ncbi:MAG: hypothetical protein KDC71_10550 [Acidobacteria bacterium]|nr:hypothetical protein [Acidobacteriota bacterium]
MAQAAQKLGFEFSGVDIPENDQTPYALRYSQFVVPLVKAVQQQDKEIQMLKEEIRQLRDLLSQ